MNILLDKRSIQLKITDEITANEVLRNVRDRLETQTEKGLAKYGHTVKYKDLELTDWIEHTQDELTDALVYLECLKLSIKDKLG